MPYVQRDAGVIVGLYSNSQPGYAEEFLADDHADVLAFRANAAPKPTFTPLQFIERFTAEEQAAISTAALANADLNLWLAKAMGAQEIDPTDTRTVAGMDALVAAGLITSARRDEILVP